MLPWALLAVPVSGTVWYTHLTESWPTVASLIGPPWKLRVLKSIPSANAGSCTANSSMAKPCLNMGVSRVMSKSAARVCRRPAANSRALAKGLCRRGCAHEPACSQRYVHRAPSPSPPRLSAGGERVQRADQSKPADAPTKHKGPQGIADILTPPLCTAALGLRIGSRTIALRGGECFLSSCCLRCNVPPDTSLLLGTVFGDPVSISFGQRAPQSSGFKILAVSRRPGLLAPGVVQITAIDRVEAEIVDKAHHHRFGSQRIAHDRESDPPRGSPRHALLEKAPGEDVVERLDHGTPDLLRDPLAVKHASLDRGDAAIAQLRMVVTDIDDDHAVRRVREQRPRKSGDGLRRDREDDDVCGFDGVDDRNGRRADLGRERAQALRPSRVRKRDLTAKPGEVARKRRSHARSADDSNSHGVSFRPAS